MPFLDDSVIIGGAYFPTVGVVDSLRAGTLMRENAQAAGALTVLAEHRDAGHRHGAGRSGRWRPGGRVTGVRTSAGDIETESA